MPFGLSEFLVIGCLGVLFFGAKRIPEVAQSLGSGIRHFRKAIAGDTDTEKEQS